MVVIEKIIINRKESGDLTVKGVVKKMQQIAVAVIDDSVGLCELPDLRFTVIKGDDLLLARFLAITDYQPSSPPTGVPGLKNGDEALYRSSPFSKISN